MNNEIVKGVYNNISIIKGKGKSIMENTVEENKIGKYYKLCKGDYDGFEYADFFEVVKETPKTVVLRELKGHGLSSSECVYYAGDYYKGPFGEFYEKRISKTKLLREYIDITLGFTGGIFYHNR